MFFKDPSGTYFSDRIRAVAIVELSEIETWVWSQSDASKTGLVFLGFCGLIHVRSDQRGRSALDWLTGREPRSQVLTDIFYDSISLFGSLKIGRGMQLYL